MKTGKVKATDLSAHGNQILHSGDVVTEDHFPRGNWDQLVAGGWITEDPARVEEPVEKEEVEEEAGEKHTLSEDDLKNNPELAEQGCKVGDEITIPEGYRTTKKGSLTKVKK